MILASRGAIAPDAARHRNASARTAARFILVLGTIVAIVGAGCSSTPADGCQKVGYIEAGSWELLDCYASAGDKAAAFQLGAMFEHGHGVPQDLEKAARYYSMAATPTPGVVSVYVPPVGDAPFGNTTKVNLGPHQDGLPAAQLALGWMYAEGRGVDRDSTVARRLAKRALNGGAEGAGELIAFLERSQ